MRDSEIEQWVLNEIRLTTEGRVKEVCVFAANGEVSLNGTVRSRADKLAAQKAAEQAKGVVAVINQLNVRRTIWATRPSLTKGHEVTAARTFHVPNNQSASATHLAS